MQYKPFNKLFAIPLRNGLTKPKSVRGTGTKMVNMGELFAIPRIRDADMDRVRLSPAERGASLLAAGDLLFARQSLVLSGAGKCSVFLGDTEDVCFESHIIRCRLNADEVEPLFYYYLFQSHQGRQLIGRIVEQGAGASGIRGSDLSNLPVPVPSRIEQQIIAKALGSLDDKIELNRQINQTLEQMAQALFQAWFVDFEPVKAKVAALADGRDPLRAAMSTLSGKTDAELDELPGAAFDTLAATAALFPEEMEASVLGAVPKGWKVRTLPEVIYVNPPRTLKKAGEAPYLDMANVPINSPRVARVVTRAFGSGSKFRNGDTLLARITPCLENGKTAFVDFLGADEVGWGSTEFIVFRPKSPLPEAFAYFLCRQPEFRTFAISNMSGTSGRQRVPNDCFANYRLAVPDQAVATAFGCLTGVAMRTIKARDEESRTLAALRDSLLPKLLSGELAVTPEGG